jgi:DNA polymerase-4
MPPAPRRWIAHLDMDAFYASVELLRYPELLGQPVVIGGGRRHQPRQRADGSREFATLGAYKGRGVITTATYPARDLGVHSGMGLMKAAVLAPQAVLLPVDHDEYKRYSRRFKAAVAEVAPCIEDRGIDEIYIDLTDVVATRLASRDEAADTEFAAPYCAREPGEAPAGDAEDEPAPAVALGEDDADAWWCAREIARELKAAVHAATGLRCSIGLAPNKLVAKIASELDKPDGLTVVPPREVAKRISPLSVRKINGIGPKSAARLAQLSIRTVGELADADPALLQRHFGPSYTGWLVAASNGRDDRPVVTYSEPKSLSRETTFDRDLHAVRDKAQLTEIFTALCTELADDLQRKRYAARTIGIKLRFEDFRTVTRDNTLALPTDDPQAIRRAAGECLKRVELGKRIRLLGVRAGALVPRAA